MWDCDHCGCQGIAGTLDFCPQCFTPRNANVPAESSASDASAPTLAAVGDRETSRAPEDKEDVVNWGEPDGKDH